MPRLAMSSTSMSKIYEKNLTPTWEVLKIYWKRFAESVTGYADKYRHEPFFRTEVNIIALQAGFALVILAVIAGSLVFLYNDISAALLQGIKIGAVSGGEYELIGSAITSDLQYMSMRHVVIVIGSVILITILFGYIMARVTLAPTRTALESQKQFIGNVAHELRTPLSTIKTNTEVALFDTTMRQSFRDMLESNVEELDRISDIINNLLSFNASLRQERMEFKNTDLGLIVETVAAKLQGLVERKEIEITKRLSEWRTVWGNATALEQIVTNVLKNAITYTPKKGHIGITVEPSAPSYVELTIQDSGSGIARKDLFRIFEPFYRAEPSRSRIQGGSGLGLTIVSELVKLHGGKIMVRSAEKRGTTVSIQLPAGEKGEEKASDTAANEIAVDFSRRKRT